MFSFTRLSCVLHVSVYAKNILRYKNTKLNMMKVTSKYVAGTAAHFYACCHLQNFDTTIYLKTYIVVILNLCIYYFPMQHIMICSFSRGRLCSL